MAFGVTILEVVMALYPSHYEPIRAEKNFGS